MSKIGVSAFRNCSSLKEIHIPSGVKTIENDTFSGCSGLEKITISSSVKEIHSYAFRNCSSLETIFIPDSVVTIAPNAFDGCRKLRDTNYCPAKLRNIDMILTPNTIKEPKLGFRGATQIGFGPEMCGITLEQMEEIHSHPLVHDESTMRDVVNLVIKPSTKSRGVGYALLRNHKQPLHADVMVSHAWDEFFRDFISCLKRSGQKGPFWVCALSIYQSDGEGDSPTIGEQLGDDPEYGPFATVLKDAVCMIAVVTAICDIYTRLWCVYELFVAQELKVPVQLCPFINDDQEKYGHLLDDVCIYNLESTIDSESAYCSYIPDKECIHKEIKASSGGFKAINNGVEMIRLNYLLDYPIQNTKRTSYTTESDEDFFKVFITFILYPLTIGLILFFIYHCSWWVILLSLAFGVVSCVITVMLINRDILSLSRAEHIVDCFGKDVIALYYHILNLKETNELRRDAIKILAEKITMMYTRMYDLDDADMPSFQDFSSSMSQVYYRAPITVFRLWKAYVKHRVGKKSKKDVKTVNSKDEEKALLEYHTFK